MIHISIFHGGGNIQEIQTRQWCNVLVLCVGLQDIRNVYIGRVGAVHPSDVYVHIVRCD